jgi:hypothetical protein
MRAITLILALLISAPASALTIETHKALGVVVKKDCTRFAILKGACRYVIEADGILLPYKASQKTRTPYFKGDKVTVEYTQYKKGWHVLSVSK